MIAIIDYGLGNVKAFANVYKKLNISAVIASTPEMLREADKLILPGVGSFDFAMQRLNQSGMRDEITELVRCKKIPVLGVCVGMQMLANSSEEGHLPGLGWIDSEVVRFDKETICVPHMGWNTLKWTRTNALLKDFDSDSRYYFLHSYYVKCNKAENNIAFTDYYGEFSCIINSENVYGVQFHPEKSHEWGVKLLQNFANL